MTVPEAAVEAAARAGCIGEFGPNVWDALPSEARQRWLDTARTFVEASAPIVERAAKAEAWDQGLHAGQESERRDPAFYSASWIRNPYRDETERGE